MAAAFSDQDSSTLRKIGLNVLILLAVTLALVGIVAVIA
jgi:hypothetical protein